MKEERRRPRERETHTHRAKQSQGEILNGPSSSPPPTPQSSFRQRLQQANNRERFFEECGVSCLRLLLPIYPS